MHGDMRRAFAQGYDYAARTLFFHDRDAFRDCVARLYALDPGFRFTWPKVASLTSTVFGFKAAGTLLLLLTGLQRSLKRSDKNCIP